MFIQQLNKNQRFSQMLGTQTEWNELENVVKDKFWVGQILNFQTNKNYTISRYLNIIKQLLVDNIIKLTKPPSIL